MSSGKTTTQAAYARSRNVSAAHINVLVKQGIIQLERGKVNPEQADRAIADYASPARADFKKNAPGPTASQSPEKGSIAYLRGVELQLKNALKKIEHDTKTGTVVNAEQLRLELAKLFTDIKTRIRAIAPKCAQEVAHLKGSKRGRELITAIESLLKKEHDGALEELSKWTP